MITKRNGDEEQTEEDEGTRNKRKRRRRPTKIILGVVIRGIFALVPRTRWSQDARVKGRNNGKKRREKEWRKVEKQT